MSQKKNNFFNLNDLSKGISRTLTEGVDATIFPGVQAMVSIVKIAPNAKGNIHEHPQEQWSLLISGDAYRIQDDEKIHVSKGDFWLTPGGIKHGVIGGNEGAVIFDFFAPPREEYKKSGSGYAAN